MFLLHGLAKSSVFFIFVLSIVQAVHVAPNTDMIRDWMLFLFFVDSSREDDRQRAELIRFTQTGSRQLCL